MKPESHEYADMFPMLDGKDLQIFADDIKRNGQNEPIIIYDGKILDGRNRYAACELAGVEPITRDYDGTDALSFVISQNLHRRHLTITQRAMMAEKVATIRHGSNQYKKEDTSKDVSKKNTVVKSLDQAAADLDISRPSVERARFIRKHGVPELVEAVESDKITVTRAAKIAKLPPEEQAVAMKEPTPKPITKPKKQAVKNPYKNNPAPTKLEPLSKLKVAWTAASPQSRKEFLAWVETQKNYTCT